MLFHYEGSPPPLDYPRPTKIDQNGTKASNIEDRHLSFDNWWAVVQFSPTSQLWVLVYCSPTKLFQPSTVQQISVLSSWTCRRYSMREKISFRPIPIIPRFWDFTNRIERSRWGMRDSLFRSRWRSKRRFPISKERTILVAGVETISSLGAFTWIWGEQYKGRKRSHRFLQDLQLSMTKGRLDWWAVNGQRDICSSHFKASNLINI